MPAKTTDDIEEILKRRHPEHTENHIRWRWLLDTLEGGERYRQAIYGMDTKGLPVRNMIRHKREYPDPRETAAGMTANLGTPGPGSAGADPAATATDDDYEMRRAQTPVPTMFTDAIESHLSHIYSQDVDRKGPDDLMKWWDDVDGTGSTFGEWMTDTVAPMLMALGQVDVYMDHPAAPKGVKIETQADAKLHEVDRCIASIILSENVVDWTLTPIGRQYETCLVREWPDGSEPPPQAAWVGDEYGGTRKPNLRRWTETDSTLYDCQGEVISRTPHGFGRVPIIRLFDRRKVRLGNVGQSRYEPIAELVRSYYNRDSELILSDSTQAHPQMQGPEDFINDDGAIPIGPGYLLPMKKNVSDGAATYQGFSVIDFPKGAAESIRKNKSDIIDQVDRAAKLTKPAGSTGNSTVSQSGVSKAMDKDDGSVYLGKLTRTLCKAEKAINALALCVLRDGDVPDGVGSEVIYPCDFDLYSLSELLAAAEGLTAYLETTGKCPELELTFAMKMVMESLPGLPVDAYDRIKAEIKAHIDTASDDRDKAAEFVDRPGTLPGELQRVVPPDPDPTDPKATGAVPAAENPPVKKPVAPKPKTPGL